MNAVRAEVHRLPAGPRVCALVAGHRSRLGRVNTELMEAGLSAHGSRLAMPGPAEAEDGLVRDVTEVLTSFCARLYGRRPVRNRAGKALRCAAHGAGPASREVTR